MPNALLPFLGRTPLFFFEADDGAPTGGSATKDEGGEERERVRATDILDRNGRDALRLAEKLADAQNDTFSLREKNRQLRQELAELKGKAPAEGATVLSAEDAATWKAYQELGKADELRQRLTASEGASTELTKLRREKLVSEVADVAKVRASVLTDRAQGLDLAVREVEENGQKVKRAVVLKDGKDIDLNTYAKDHWADYLPALQLQGSISTTSSGTTFVRQSGGKPATTNPAQSYLQKAYGRKQS